MIAAVVALALLGAVPASQPAITKDPITKETRPELFRDEPPPLAGASRPSDDGAPSEPPESATAFWVKMLLRTVVVLGAVVLLAYLILNKGLSRLVKLTGGTSQTRSMTVIERHALSPKHTLYIVEVQGRRLLVGTAEHAISLIADLRDSEPPSAMTVSKGTTE